VTLSTPVTVMGVGFAIEGEGYIKLPCQEFGDIDVTASVEITEVTPDLENTLGGIVGFGVEGTLVGDCSTTWELGLEITMPDDASIDIGPISIPLPNTITFGYYKDPETTTLSFGFEYDMFEINFMTDSATGMKMAQLTVKEGVTLRKLFKGVMDIFTSGGDSGKDAVDDPMDGISGAGAATGAAANLGDDTANLGGIGDFFDTMLDTELPDIEITIAKAG